MDIEKMMKAFSVSRGDDFFTCCSDILQTAESSAQLDARWNGLKKYWSEHLSPEEILLLETTYQASRESRDRGEENCIPEMEVHDDL
jgi:hypothetical protein